MESLQVIERALLVGVGATVVLDTWLVLLRFVGAPTLDFALVGRWIGHLFRGSFAHAAIGRAAPIPGELALGWLTHYAIGVGFAAILLRWQGTAWAQQPTLGPAVLMGVVTVVAPLLVMQPAMGAGFASSKTATPVRNVIRSVANHAVFGLGLYLFSLFAAQILPR